MYSRFKALESYGEEELEKVKNSKVAVVGLGATGSVIAEHLARHGVNLVLIDRDYLEENDVYSSNIYTPEQCERSIPKAVAAERYLSKFTEVNVKVESINPENIDILDDADLVLDGTDNMKTRHLIDEFSKKNNLPWIYTAALSEKGYSMFLDKKCFNCIFKQLNTDGLKSCETAGVLREVSTISGSISARKAVRYLSGKNVEEILETTSGKSFELKNQGCKVCEENFYENLTDSRSTVAVCGENKYQLNRDIGEKSLENLKELCKLIAENDYLTRLHAKGRQITVFNSGRIILEAEDKGHAEALASELGL